MSKWADHYILDEQGNPVPENDLFAWAHWFEKADRTVARTRFGNIEVSTVFLSLPHVSKELGNDDMMLYETMVFAATAILKRLSELGETDDRSIMMLFLNVLGGREEWDIQKRYATKAEALEGHKQMCTFIEVCLAGGLLEITSTVQKDEL